MTTKEKVFKILTFSLYSVGGVGFGLIFFELFARFGLGLGTPPLSVSHPSIEYLFKPSQDVKRFGNRFQTNAFGMRSDNFPPQSALREKRILVFGDSVVVGGAQMDQRFIATEILKKRIIASSPGEVVNVGNVSAGSWGPGNWLAWVNEYGSLGASRAILVVSSHDLEDHPAFATLNPLTHPQKNPPSATHELLLRYLNLNSALNKLRSHGLFRRSLPIQSLVSQAGSKSNPGPVKYTINMTDSANRGLSDLRDLVFKLQANGVKVAVVQFWERDETTSRRPRPQQSLMLELFQGIGVPVIQSGEFFHRCSKNPAVDLYVDAIHPYTEAGQSCLADSIEAAVNALGPMQ